MMRYEIHHQNKIMALTDNLNLRCSIARELELIKAGYTIYVDGKRQTKQDIMRRKNEKGN